MAIADVLASFLLGGATTLAVQTYVIPRVDTRRRRAERFERNMLELGELLTSELEERAYQAWPGAVAVPGHAAEGLRA